jgi:ribosomal protein S18 acetylase RimI-like enzyme
MLPRLGPGGQVVSLGGRSLRIAPRPETATVGLSPLPGGLPTIDLVRLALATIASAHGSVDVITTALHRSERAPFEACGFVPVDRLHLLARRLDDRIPPSTKVRRARRRDWPALEALDARAFAPLWHLDRVGMEDAMRATAAARLRIGGGREAVGYAIVGCTGRRGYVQRLAVDPGAEGRGWGTALLLDGLRWLQRRGAESALVNTQETNARARQLYERHGFVLEPDGLVVLGRRAGAS